MIRITQRDEAIIEFLNEVKVADTQTLCNIFFNGKLRASQLRLKALVDYKYIKVYRENVISQNIYYVKRKPTQIKHSLILSKFIGELYKSGIEVLKIRVPLKVGKVIADGFIAIKYNNEPKIFLIEVENTKYFDTGKYIELKQTREYKSKFPVMPSIICISDKNNKTDDKLDVIFLKTDLSDMENLIIKL